MIYLVLGINDDVAEIVLTAPDLDAVHVGIRNKSLPTEFYEFDVYHVTPHGAMKVQHAHLLGKELLWTEYLHNEEPIPHFIP